MVYENQLSMDVGWGDKCTRSCDDPAFQFKAINSPGRCQGWVYDCGTYGETTVKELNNAKQLYSGYYHAGDWHGKEDGDGVSKYVSKL